MYKVRFEVLMVAIMKITVLGCNCSVPNYIHWVTFQKTVIFCITLKESSFLDGDWSPMDTMINRRHTEKKTTPKIANGSELLKASSACTMQTVRAKDPKTNKKKINWINPLGLKLLDIGKYIVMYYLQENQHLTNFNN